MLYRSRTDGRLSMIALYERKTAALALLVGLLSSACGRGNGQARGVVPAGATVRVAADSLERAGVVRSARLFLLYARLTGRARAIRAGTYRFQRGVGWGEVLDDLAHGRGETATVTVPEGFAISQIGPLLVTALGVPTDSVDAAVRDSALRRRLNVPAETVEGYLFPDTYAFPAGTSARAAVMAMVRRFEDVWRPAWDTLLSARHLSRHEGMTLASIVEKEARRPGERPMIAAVYTNRLRDGMPLQADPTVQYARGEHTQRVLYKDLEIDSPYNTYRHRGLPPGPVASPGKASIEAAVAPANVPYKYFVAGADGHHEFRTTLAEHNRAKEALRRRNR
ncbi:MAG: endolytic transglycosylase MltG [Gemmatimonadaceae bacterium]